MKANETKSKFVYPDKLYARTNDNITLDISYAPQTLEAVEYTRTDAFIKKAAEWMFSQANVYTVTHVSNDGGIHTNFYADKMVEDFRKYMEE